MFTFSFCSFSLFILEQKNLFRFNSYVLLYIWAYDEIFYRPIAMFCIYVFMAKII